MKPILFNTGMVRAILEGRKTVTRRVVKPQPVLDGHFWRLGGAGWGDNISSFHPVPCHSLYNHAPYHPGDILWVRETWQFIPCIDCRMYEHGSCNDVPVTYDDGDIMGEGCFVYRADYPETDRISWRPSIHMPREAARIFLRVTDVRVERLQDITEAGAKAEGAVKAYPYTNAETGKTAYMQSEDATYRGGFSCIWDSTIKSKDRPVYGWEANPWVWVIEFERISKEEAINGA
nr:hypothetical protein [uncultured Agathobaculum sp.]